jgi:hypothetical protein
MPSHHWGDKWFEEHGHKLDKSISYCCLIWRTYGRIGTHGKEKYGTFRDQLYPYRAYWAVHELLKPGHAYYRWGKKIMKADIALGCVIRFLRLDRLITKYQALIYNYAIQQACKRYPEITDEIVSDLEGYEWVRPGIFGPVCGKTIHEKYWTRVE